MGVVKSGVLWCEGGRKCPSEELPPYCAVKVMIAARSIVFKLYGVLSRSAIVITRCVKLAYRIYSINRPGRLLNFWTLRVGAYSRWALIRGWALMKFSPVSASEVCLFCNKTINANNKTRRSNKSRFLSNTLKKTPSSGKSLIRIYSLKWVGWGWALIWVWLGGGGVGA